VDLKVVAREKNMDLWLELQDVKKGQVHLRLTWLGFSDDKPELKNALMESQTIGLASSMLTVHLDSVTSLPVSFSLLYFVCKIVNCKALSLY